MNERLDLQVSENDLLKAYRAHHPLFPRKQIAIYALFAIFLGIALALLQSPQGIGHAALLVGGLLIVITITFLLLQFVLRRWWMPRYTKRIYAQQTDLRMPFEQSWNEDALTMSNANSNGSIAWSDFHQWLRTDNVLLIYRSEALFNIMPLHNEEARRAADTIIALLQKAGVPQRKTA